MTSPLDMIHTLAWADLPTAVRHQAKLCLLDHVGIAAGGLGTRLSAIIRDHAAEDWPGDAPLLFDARTASLPAAAMAHGMTLDALDGHDGYNPAKGHIGAPLIPVLLSLAVNRGISGEALLATLVMGYEFGARAAEAQHATCPDYHTSGSWGAVTAAAGAARLMGLGPDQTRHALGIAEYHGPRSQMMRVIDSPTMLKDGAGWGAMTGLSAAQMAARGFTGAPAITVENAPEHWQDLGEDWRILRQYFKPYPVCRWAQAPAEAILALRAQHALSPADVIAIRIETFAEACRLATAAPRTTEEAQYSTSFPCALAMVRGTIAPEDLDGAALRDDEVLRLSHATRMTETEHANAAFPTRRLARVALTLRDGRELQSGWTEPKWDHTAPPSPDELRAKYDALAIPVLGPDRAGAIADAIDALDRNPAAALTDLLYRPI